MPVGQFHSEHGIRQQFNDFPLYFNSVFLGHVNISGAPSVTSTVCSKWAEGRPSAVTTVHLSSSTRTFAWPMLIIGSIARVMPCRRTGPVPRLPKLGIWG